MQARCSPACPARHLADHRQSAVSSREKYCTPRSERESNFKLAEVLLLSTYSTVRVTLTRIRIVDRVSGTYTYNRDIRLQTHIKEVRTGNKSRNAINGMITAKRGPALSDSDGHVAKRGGRTGAPLRARTSTCSCSCVARCSMFTYVSYVPPHQF